MPLLCGGNGDSQAILESLWAELFKAGNLFNVGVVWHDGKKKLLKPHRLG
jgi:hypothetical protein